MGSPVLTLNSTPPPPPLKDLKDTTTKMPKKANIFESFSHSAIQQFKEAFGIMDTDKDGLLSASDLVAAFGAHGKSIGSGDAQAMLDEVDGPMNFTQMSPSSPPKWLVDLMMTMSSLLPSPSSRLMTDKLTQ